ncbi:MAG: DUF1853 family protein [Verrucomicrobiales bacterium]
MGRDDHDQQLRRDLEWAVSSPPLMRGATLAPGHACHGLPGPEDCYSGHRVGYYFESLIDYWLRSELAVEMLAHRQQIQDAGRTIGELDFVFRDRQGRTCHWEVAVKFYLYCADRRVADSHFIGPNAGDTFERKWERLQTKQLPLCRHVFPEVSECSALVKGRIFYHPDQPRPSSLPDGLMPDHLRGIWLRASELSWLESAGPQSTWNFRILLKPFWLAPVRLDGSASPPSSLGQLRAELARHFDNSNHPVLVSCLSRVDGGWEEGERLFVVADGWPEL